MSCGFQRRSGRKSLHHQNTKQGEEPVLSLFLCVAYRIVRNCPDSLFFRSLFMQKILFEQNKKEAAAEESS